MAKIAQNYTNTRNSQYTQQSLFCNKIGIKIKGACVIFNQSLQSNLVIRNVLIRNFLQITSPFIPFCLFRTGFLQAVKIKFEISKSSFKIKFKTQFREIETLKNQVQIDRY